MKKKQCVLYSILIAALATMLLFSSGCSMLGAHKGEPQLGIVGTLGNGTPELSDVKAVAPYVSEKLKQSADPNMQIVGTMLGSWAQSETSDQQQAETRVERLQRMSEELKTERKKMAEENDQLQALQLELDSAVILDVPVSESNPQVVVDPGQADPVVEQTAKAQLGALLQNTLVQALITGLVETGKMDSALLNDPASADDLAAILDNPLARTMVLGYLKSGALDPTPLLNEFKPTDAGLDELMKSPLLQPLLLAYVTTGRADPAILFDPDNLDDIVAVLSNPAARQIVDGYIATGELNLTALMPGA